MLRYFLLFLCLYASATRAAITREDIITIKKQKEALSLEQKRLMGEADTIGKMIEELSLLSEQKKGTLVDHQEEIARALPLLARLERSNPLRLLVDPTTGQYKVRGIILMRHFVSALKRKMQEVQMSLNEIKLQANELEIKNQSTQQLIQDLEQKKTKLSSLESQKIEDWTRAEVERFSKEDDPNTLLDESRATLSKTARAISAATASKGLPFRRLDQPVPGKVIKDSALQNKFSPHNQGIIFETQKNARVCAPAKGKVVFKGPFRTHAEILIIDHGETAHTILMGMHKIDAEAGQNVYAGEKLGTMAGYGAGQPRLYLELRHKGKSIDPTPYFVKKNLE